RRDRPGAYRAHVHGRATGDRPTDHPLEDENERQDALDRLERQQVADFEGLLEAMDGLPVVVRLLDPPLHEFLPDRMELEHEILRRVWAGRSVADLQRMSEEVARWHEDNPML